MFSLSRSRLPAVAHARTRAEPLVEEKLKLRERDSFPEILGAALFVKNSRPPMDAFKMLTQTEYLKKGAA